MPRKEDIPETDLETLRAEVARLTAALAALGADVSTVAEEKAERLKTAGADALAGAGGWAKAHPGQTLGLAAGLGFLLGLLIGRR